MPYQDMVVRPIVIPANAGGDPMRRRPDGVGAVIPANAGRFD